MKSRRPKHFKKGAAFLCAGDSGEQAARIFEDLRRKRLPQDQFGGVYNAVLSHYARQFPEDCLAIGIQIENSVDQGYVDCVLCDWQILCLCMAEFDIIDAVFRAAWRTRASIESLKSIPMTFPVEPTLPEAINEIETLSGQTDELVLVVPPRHHLARRKHIRPGDPVKESYINREPGSASRALVEKHLLSLNLSLEASLELGNPETVKQAVKDGLGIAFISKSAIETELKASSLVAPKVLGLNINRKLKIIYRKSSHLSRAANAFIQMAQGVGKQDQ
jgi:hypothetical protein